MNTTNLEEKITTSQELEFVIFCIENIASKLNKDSKTIYQALNKSDIINGYIVPEYGILHTQSKEYILQDIIDVMAERGIDI